MAIKKFKPTSDGRRFMTISAFEEITKGKPEKKLVESLGNCAGRNNTGRITMRHRGGGAKRKYRIIDFRRNKLGVPGTVAAFEYDPNRTARIALIHYLDGEKRYILAPNGVKEGATLLASPKAEPVPGNSLPLSAIPLGMPIHAIELVPGAGAKLVRSAGMVSRIAARDDVYSHIKLPSGETRKISSACYATVGQVGNLEHENISLGKAGRKRWKGIRPTVRGVAMNPVDHPMGGGEGRTSGGGHPVTPWGQLTKGKRTRSKRKPSGKFIVQRRKK